MVIKNGYRHNCQKSCRLVGLPIPNPLLGVSDHISKILGITNEGPLRTYSVVHPEYTIQKHASKPLPNPNLDDRLPLCPHYYPGPHYHPENQQESNGALAIVWLTMTDGIPVELCVLPLQNVVQDQASYVQDQKVST
jgi:hypothetical protein